MGSCPHFLIGKGAGGLGRRRSQETLQQPWLVASRGVGCADRGVSRSGLPARPNYSAIKLEHKGGDACVILALDTQAKSQGA